MKPLFSSLKSGLLALGLVAGVTVPSVAGPILQPDLGVATNSAAPNIIPVRDGWAGGNGGMQRSEEHTSELSHHEQSRMPSSA